VRNKKIKMSEAKVLITKSRFFGAWRGIQKSLGTGQPMTLCLYTAIIMINGFKS
jgi:hypothetical protein